MEEVLSLPFLAATRSATPPREGPYASSPPQMIQRLQSTARHEEQGTTEPISAIDSTAPPLPTVLSRSWRRSRYHIFISHMQQEASGDVGTLFFLFEQMGIHGWRDMNQTDLTEAGMRQGVYDSDVFILFLTNSYLSRPFCLLELKWALEFGKKIVIVQEIDERFWPFDLERWKSNRCHRERGGWVEGGLKTTYEQCPALVRDFIESYDAGAMLPFRRRDFEVNALTREILRRASEHDDVIWGSPDGSHLPPPAALRCLDPATTRRIFVFTLDSLETTAMIDDFKSSVEDIAPATVWAEDIAGATHAVMLLVAGSVKPGTASAVLLEEAAEIATTNSFIHFLYVTGNWDFDEFYDLHTRAPTIATRGVASHECMQFRPRDPPPLRYEHDALILEMLRRMRTSSS